LAVFQYGNLIWEPGLDLKFNKVDCEMDGGKRKTNNGKRKTNKRIRGKRNNRSKRNYNNRSKRN
jgi:hypothetical protein